MQVFEQHESRIRGYCRSYPTVFKTASNARQYDEDGKSYIDFFAGAGVLNFGHNNPRMKAAVIDYIQNDGVLHSLDMYTTAKREFIRKFVSVILEPRGMQHKLQFMGPTGTNAVEAALKLARRVTGRHAVVAFSNGFHGMTLGALACTANEYFRKASGIPLNHVIRASFDDGIDALDSLRAQFQDPAGGLDKPAAFILESVQAEGGVFVADPDWLRAVERLAHDLGALLIIDDIQAGCGRTGSYFSFDGMGLDPDIVTLAKGIGGIGTPIAMNLVKPEHDEHWQPSEHTGTFRGQGLSFVAGAEALSYFENDLLEQETLRKGEIMKSALDMIAGRFSDNQFDVRGKGMMQALDVADGALAKKIAADCFSSGLLIGPCGSGGKVLKLIPPLTIPDEDLEEGLQIFTTAVIRCMEAA